MSIERISDCEAEITKLRAELRASQHVVVVITDTAKTQEGQIASLRDDLATVTAERDAAKESRQIIAGAAWRLDERGCIRSDHFGDDEQEQRIMQNIMQGAKHEILRLRRENEILGVQVEVVEVFAAALGLRRANNAGAPDVVHELQKAIDQLNAPQEKEPWPPSGGAVPGKNTDCGPAMDRSKE